MNQAYLLNDLSTIKDNISSMMVVIQDLKTEVESLKQELNASKSSNDTKDHEIKFLQKRVKDQVWRILLNSFWLNLIGRSNKSSFGGAEVLPTLATSSAD